MTGTLHVAGLVVHAQPDRIELVRVAIEGIEGAQVHAENEAGKLVVTLEAASDARIVEQLAAINAVAGVVASALVYEHHEDMESMGHGHRTP